MSESEVETPEEKPFLKVIVHSFFIIPFLIAVFCVLLFGAMHLLTRENRTVYDYLEDVKTGGLNKRWQGAFELSKVLANANLYPKEERFTNELIVAFKQSKHDDDRVRQYLALAMGRTGRNEFVQPLVESLQEGKEVNLPALIYAIGMLKQKETASALHKFTNHSNPRLRSITMSALGNIANPVSIMVLKKGLQDSEANVRWGAAISLAHMGDSSGKNILLQMLNREYFSQFPEVDPDEETSLLSAAIDAAGKINSQDLNIKIQELAKSDKNMNVRSAALKVMKK